MTRKERSALLEKYKDGGISELENLRRKNWAVDNKDGKALTGDNFLNFINTEFFSTLKNVSVIDTRQQN